MPLCNTRTCLSMMVQNEGQIISRCLESVRARIDTWVIIDTGSDDDTCQKVLNILHDIPGELIRSPWNTYTHHRNQSLSIAAPKADYTLILDADETLCPSEKQVTEKLNKDLYYLEIFSTSSSRMQPRLIKNSLKWAFQGTVKEHLVIPESIDRDILKDFKISHHKDGIRAKNPGRLYLEAFELKKELIKYPDDFQLMMDIGDIYRQLHKWKLAHEYFDHLSELKIDVDSKWYALYHAARAREMMNKSFSKVAATYHKAFDLCPERAEPLYRLASVTRQHRKFSESLQLARIAESIPFNSQRPYFERPVYKYLTKIEIIRSLYGIKDYLTAMDSLNHLIQIETLPESHRKWAKELAGHLEKKVKQVRENESIKEEKKDIPRLKPTSIGRKKKLTIGMATYNDYQGVFFTTMMIRLYHPEVLDDTEILVIDNNPGSKISESLKNLDQRILHYRYFPFNEYHSTAVRDMIFREANAEYVLCIDSHVLIESGAIQKLISYFEKNPQCRDLLQGPLFSEDLKTTRPKFDPTWRKGMFGVWVDDARGKNKNGQPFEIPMQGLGLFACRKDAWLGFNPKFIGFGGEEGYIHEKYRNRGKKTLCLPFLRWLHRFDRPGGPEYPIGWEDRIRNYMIGFTEIGLDTKPINEHFSELLGQDVADKIFLDIKREMDSPFHNFDAIYCINMNDAVQRWQAMKTRFQALGIEKRVRRFSAIETRENHHVGCALSHRSIIESAKKQNLKNVLVLEDDAIFLDRTIYHLRKSVKELEKKDWHVFFLGGHRWDTVFEKAQDCQFLEKPVNLTTSHAVVYNKNIYDQILNNLPDNILEMEEWLKKYIAIDQYLPRYIDKLFLASPSVASQVQLLPQEKAEHRKRFTLGDDMGSLKT